MGERDQRAEALCAGGVEDAWEVEVAAPPSPPGEPVVESVALALDTALAVVQKEGELVTVALAPEAEAVARAGVGEGRGEALVMGEGEGEEESVVVKLLEEEAVAGRVGAEVMEAVGVGDPDSSPVAVELEDSVPPVWGEGVGGGVG